ncbi:phosphonate degradation associated HDIG domain protein [Thermoflavifilum aggregans]|uniref:Phosphonate degradation associated HDIG domain protein n=1 Tax=Thermoflavifilum aggregans TaxID=454188 RepID=A0A2M9CSC5_9BACT|nr:HD domain-containing protein [Thermoflavifilum aggregans]PJJ74842.1 phosphonate degradation associated HDIG domain protein [Thermoflavifilum aggregans]
MNIHSKAREATEEVMYLIRTFGHEDYLGEAVSQLEHMCQCAELARLAQQQDEVILAAFLHDIGHLCSHLLDTNDYKVGDYGVIDHDVLGAKYLFQKGFSTEVVTLVGSHVQAKRYLAYVQPSYLKQLSPASIETLKLQGGAMTPEEARRFEQDPHFELYIQLRKWDEQAKVPGTLLPDLDMYEKLIYHHLVQQFALCQKSD